MKDVPANRSHGGSNSPLRSPSATNKPVLTKNTGQYRMMLVQAQHSVSMRVVINRVVLATDYCICEPS